MQASLPTADQKASGLKPGPASFAFAVGLVSILAQVVILRELSVALYGVELIYVLALGAWLLASASGALLGRSVPRAAGRPLLPATFVLLAAALPADIALARSVRLMFSGVPGAFLPFAAQLAALALVVFPVALPLGALFQWAAAAGISGGGTLARAYAVESLGGVCGGLLATVLLALGAGNLASALVCALLSVAAGQIHLPGNRLRLGWPNPVSMAVAGVLALGLWFSDALDFRSTAWTHPNLVEIRDSPYGRVTVEQLGGELSVFENDALSFNTEGTEAEEFVQLAALQHPAPESVLILGGGIEGLVREILSHRPRRVVDVELNPVLERVVRSRLPSGLRKAELDPAVEFRLEDPRAYLRHEGPPFDLILVGMPEPSSGQANRFYTREFFAQCRARMTPEGVLALRLASSENLWTPQIAQRAGSIHGALRSVFRDVVVVPGSTNVLAASMTALCRDPEVLAARLAERRLSLRLVSPPYLRYVFTNDRFGEVAGLLEQSSAPVNSDARPVCYQYTAMIWLSKFFPSFAAMQARGFPPWWSAVLWSAGVLALAGLVAASRRPRARRLLLVGSAGLAGTVLETVLMLRYQVTSGVLYQNLGVLLMSFMAGLWAGAAAVDTPLARAAGRDAWRALLSLSALLLPALVWWQIHAGVEAGLVAIGAELAASGFLVAGFFAYASLEQGVDQAELAAPLYAADLAGGCLGTLAASLVMIPVLGLAQTAAWLAGLAVLMSLWTRRLSR